MATQSITTATNLLPRNTNRYGLVIENRGPSVAYYLFGTSGSPATDGISIQVNEKVTMDAISAVQAVRVEATNATINYLEVA